MKNIYPILMILLLSNYSIAQKNNYENNKDATLSYEEYINEYGVNDTSIAIVNLFFDKRDYSSTGKMSFLPLSATVTVFIPPLGIGLMAISSPLFVSGLITRNKYSHKNLIETLDNYQKNNVLSIKIKKKLSSIIEDQKYREIDMLAELDIATLKSIKK